MIVGLNVSYFNVSLKKHIRLFSSLKLNVLMVLNFSNFFLSMRLYQCWIEI